MELTEQTKGLIKSEISNNIEKLSSMMREVKFWLWTARSAFILLLLSLGGSVYGLSQIDNYIDNKIISRINQLDKLPIALAQANAEDYDDAIETMDDLWLDIYESNIKVSDKFEETYINNYVWILGNVVYSPNNNNDYWLWIKSQWERLQINHKFIKIKINLKDDADFQRSLAITKLKFSPTSKNLKSAIDRMNSALKYEDNSVQKSFLYYDLALLNILNDDITAASISLKSASKLHPAEFLIDDWGKYSASYFSSPDFEMWEFIAFEFKIPELKILLNNAFQLASKPNN